MPRTVISSVFFVLLAWSSIQPASAQQSACTERNTVLGQLAAQYSEAPVAIGLATNGGVLEVLSSKQGESSTIIITMPNGATCLIAAGESWEKVPRIAQADPSA